MDTVRVSLGEAAYRRLREDIITCTLLPGQRVTEKELAASRELGIAPVRQALTRLAHEGLVRTIPRKGYQVAPLSPKIVDDLFAVWRVVGTELVRLGVQHATPAQLAEIARGFAEIDEATHEVDGRHVIRAADETFRMLAEATENTYLIAVSDRLSGDLARVFTLVLGNDPSALTPDSTMDWVRDILDQRNADAAAASTARMIDRSREAILQALTRWPSVMEAELSPIPTVSRA
ncbi:GntR family transcriptional regulator [Agromyces sp. SYSU T00266]|uniref:GntR family transcriptional regulator n=1 Tax=Agromyces zhanjiangensis TaxID=3158562 RepID=UPI0033982FDD